jgi:glutamate/aspartate transport system substrate-binding protein
VEPYGIMVRKGDARLLAIINKTLTNLYAGNEINQLYTTWFDTEKLKVPMSRLFREAVRRPNTDPGFAHLLGYSL